jgi:GDP-L-fucose synthase
MKVYSEETHVNVGFGSDITIAELAQLIAQIVGFDGEITFDEAKPDGTPQKLLDSRRIQALGWLPKVPLAEGISRTYEWYLSSWDQHRRTEV